MALPAAGFGRLARSYYNLPVNELLVGLARQRVGMTAVRRMGGGHVCMYYWSFVVLDGDKAIVR